MHCRFGLPLIQIMPDLLTDEVSLYLKRQCHRPLLRAPAADPARLAHAGGRPCLARDDVARVIRDAQTGAIGAHEREVEPELLIGRAVVLGDVGDAW